MQELVTTAMLNTGLEKGRKLAKDIANKYLQNVYCNFKAHDDTLFEKYPSDYVSWSIQRAIWVNNLHFLYQSKCVYLNLQYCGSESKKKGDGGEYEVQEGFGWTNGVAMHYLKAYGDQITLDDSYSSSATSIQTNIYGSSMSVLILLASMLLTTVFWRSQFQYSMPWLVSIQSIPTSNDIIW